MKALRLFDIGDLRCETVPRPEPDSGEQRVRVLHCAVCRTDAKMWRSGQRDLVLPRILGHEVVGVSEMDDHTVAVWPGSACGACPACRTDRENLCPHMEILGFHRDGGYAGWLTAPASSLIPLPPALDPEVACLAEPLACGLNALERARADTGDRVLVCGGGPVGLLLAFAAACRGCEVSVAEIDRNRVARAAHFRAAAGIQTIPGSATDSFDVAVNAAPDPDCFTTWLPRLRPGGRYVLFSGLTNTRPVSPALLNEVHYRELEVCGAYGCTRAQMRSALQLLQEHPAIASLMIEREIALNQVERAFEELLNGRAFKHIVRLD